MMTYPAAGSHSDSSKMLHPIVLTPGATPPPTTTSSALPSPIPASALSLSPALQSLSTAASYLAVSLDSCSSLPRLSILLTNFIAVLTQSLALPPPPATLELAIRAVAPYFPASVGYLVAFKARILGAHYISRALVLSGGVPSHPPSELIPLLCDKDWVYLLCASLSQAPNIRPAEILTALRYFLTPLPFSDKASDAMAAVRCRWERAATACREKSDGENESELDQRARNWKRAADSAALLLSAGHDGFTPAEVCLHYLFASRNLDSVVLGAAVAELDGGEVVMLMRYLGKWIYKYGGLPEAQTRLEAVQMLGADQCKSVPSFAAVARALGVLLDNHLPHLLLNADAKQDLKSLHYVLRELSAKAEYSGPILHLLPRFHQDK